MRTVPARPFAEALAPPSGPMLGLLGPPVLVDRDRLVPLRLRPKAIALVAYLALADCEVRRHEVARLLFPEAEGPLAALRWHLAHLRSAGPPLVARGLRATRSALSLPVATDVAWFRRGADVVMRRPGVSGAARVLALYRDDLVAGLSVSTTAEFDNWLYVAQEGLRRRFRQATVAFARWALTARRAPGAVAPLARLVTVDPYYEEGHVLLIETYEALGETGHATAAYDRYQRIVRRELAAEPQPAVARRFEAAVSPRPTLPREDLVPLREVTLHVVDWSGGEPTILGLHGSAGMAHSFGALAERLTPAHRFVGVDLRGHGFSDKPPSGYDLERHVADICQLIAALQMRRPVLLGHSAGGAIATFVATKHRCRGAHSAGGDDRRPRLRGKRRCPGSAAGRQPRPTGRRVRYLPGDVARALGSAHGRGRTTRGALGAVRAGAAPGRDLSRTRHPQCRGGRVGVDHRRRQSRRARASNLSDTHRPGGAPRGPPSCLSRATPTTPR
jgi:pimeloyl-ACP methyl ester carboxylesterase/DNA-binding SARP family transcriptional activator